ncbi:MAG: hypothetical protein O3C40_29030 [Planctomycetota bacterium]|nr:hypothetical protein [Planctomycetota bacterium]
MQRPTRIDKKRFVQTFALQELGEIDLQRGNTRITIEVLHKPAGEG